MAYSKTEGKGRVVYLANGHSPTALGNPAWQQIFVRSVRYAAGEDWSNKTVNVAAIGYGGAFNMGKLHLDSCSCNRLTPVAFRDLDPWGHTVVAKTELGEHIQTYTKVEDLLAKSDAEMCIVITPHNTHAAAHPVPGSRAARQTESRIPFPWMKLDAGDRPPGRVGRRWRPPSTTAGGRHFLAITRRHSGQIGEVCSASKRG